MLTVVEVTIGLLMVMTFSYVLLTGKLETTAGLWIGVFDIVFFSAALAVLSRYLLGLLARSRTSIRMSGMRVGKATGQVFIPWTDIASAEVKKSWWSKETQIRTVSGASLMALCPYRSRDDWFSLVAAICNANDIEIDEILREALHSYLAVYPQLTGQPRPVFLLPR
jgi:hypothetical protein